MGGDVGSGGLLVDSVSIATSIKADGQIEEIDLLATDFHSKFYGWVQTIEVVKEICNKGCGSIPYTKDIVNIAERGGGQIGISSDSNLLMKTSEMKNPSGDPIGIPMSAGRQYTSSLH